MSTGAPQISELRSHGTSSSEHGIYKGDVPIAFDSWPRRGNYACWLPSVRNLALVDFGPRPHASQIR
eukprot:6829504-Alexandrium_andersonii.AAC.1